MDEVDIEIQEETKTDYGSIPEVKKKTIPKYSKENIAEFKHDMIFNAQFSLSLGVIIFSFFTILRRPDANNTISYSLISSILGYWLPSPTKKSD